MRDANSVVTMRTLRVQHNIAEMQEAHAHRRADELTRLLLIHGRDRVAKALAAFPILLDPDDLTNKRMAH